MKPPYPKGTKVRVIGGFAGHLGEILTVEETRGYALGGNHHFEEYDFILLGNDLEPVKLTSVKPTGKFKVGDTVRVVKIKGDMANSPSLCKQWMGETGKIAEIKDAEDGIILEDHPNYRWYPEEFELVKEDKVGDEDSGRDIQKILDKWEQPLRLYRVPKRILEEFKKDLQ